MRRLGANHTIVLSDHWSYPAHAWRPAGRPWTNLEGFAAWVRQFAQPYKGRGVFYWDIWNEPDFKIFWDGTQHQFYERFALAERTLREELGSDARIVAPSTAMWRLDWIQGMAEFCLERGCRFDAVSWHDLPDDMHSLPRLSARGETTRALLAQPRYQSLGVREIHGQPRSWDAASSSCRAPRSATSRSSRAREPTWRSSRAGRTAVEG